MDDAIKAVLQADGTLSALATGGIYTRTELGLSGINARTASTAYQSNGLLKPCILIVTGEDVPDNQINDEGAQVQSTQETARINIYQDGSTNRATAESMAERVYVLLHAKQVSNRRLLRSGTIKTRDSAMNNAHLVRASYTIHGVTKV